MQNIIYLMSFIFHGLYITSNMFNAHCFKGLNTNNVLDTQQHKIFSVENVHDR